MIATMKIKRTSVLATATLVVALLSVGANAITLTLRNHWIEQYQRRVTIDGLFTVEHAHASPNRIGAGSLDQGRSVRPLGFASSDSQRRGRSVRVQGCDQSLCRLSTQGLQHQGGPHDERRIIKTDVVQDGKKRTLQYGIKRVNRLSNGLAAELLQAFGD